VERSAGDVAFEGAEGGEGLLWGEGTVGVRYVI